MKGLVFPDSHLRAAMPPERFAAEILRIEQELDEVHPTWRDPVMRGGRPAGIVGSYGIDDLERKARVKYLLQRRKHLYDGKDWEVIVKMGADRSGNPKLFAMPVISKPRPTQMDIAAASRRVWAKQPSLPQVADRLGVSLKQVETWILDCPEGEGIFHHCRRRKMAADKARGEALPEVQTARPPRRATPKTPKPTE